MQGLVSCEIAIAGIGPAEGNRDVLSRIQHPVKLMTMNYLQKLLGLAYNSRGRREALGLTLTLKT